MAVAWYAVKVWKLTSQDGQITDWGTRLSHSWMVEDWTLTKHDGSTQTVPRHSKRLRRRGMTAGAVDVGHRHKAADAIVLGLCAIATLAYLVWACVPCGDA